MASVLKEFGEIPSSFAILFFKISVLLMWTYSLRNPILYFPEL
jgi:hypothetical protein